MRALWTAAGGMTGQQMNVDVISNNLANVNTTAYKKDRVEFKDLVYAKMNKAYNLDTEKPAGMQVGLGAMPSAIVKNFEGGTLEANESTTAFAIEGEGFFTLKDPQGDIIYTKDGNFSFSPTDEGLMLVNTQGYPVLDSAGNSILFDELDPEMLSVGETGEIYIMTDEGVAESIGISMGIVRFRNPIGLESIGNNNYVSTDASGQPVWESELDEGEKKSTVLQGYLEGSNVQLVDEMVNLIVAQRAYEVNSKIIQASDDMLSQANNLKR